jgi:hypothetical protein
VSSAAPTTPSERTIRNNVSKTVPFGAHLPTTLPPTVSVHVLKTLLLKIVLRDAWQNALPDLMLTTQHGDVLLAAPRTLHYTEMFSLLYA